MRVRWPLHTGIGRLSLALIFSFLIHLGFIYFSRPQSYLQLPAKVENSNLALQVSLRSPQFSFETKTVPLSSAVVPSTADKLKSIPYSKLTAPLPPVTVAESKRSSEQPVSTALVFSLPYSSADELSRPPILLSPLPEIKAAAGVQDEPQHGSIKLRLIIDKGGRALFVDVQESNLSSVVTDQIIQGLYVAEYAPGEIDAQAVVAEMFINAEFEF